MYAFKPLPHTLPPAGLSSKDEGHLTAAECLCRRGGACAAASQPPTSSYQQQCGAALQQQRQQEGPPSNSPHAHSGRGGTSREGVELCLRPSPAAPHLQLLQEAQEANYKRSKLEPLGRPRERGVALPPGLGTERAFGVAVNARELERNNQGKHTIYPLSPSAATAAGGSPHAAAPPPAKSSYTAAFSPGAAAAAASGEDKVHALYLRSHRDWAPGEQRTYDYNWKGANPKELCFGKPPCPGSAAELKAALQPGVVDELGALPERLQRVALRSKAALGVPCSPNALERNLPMDVTYGRPPAQGEWGADRILRGGGGGQEERQHAEKRLGRQGGHSPHAAWTLPQEGSPQRLQQTAGAGNTAEPQQLPQQRHAGAILPSEWDLHINMAASPSLLCAAGARPPCQQRQQQATMTQLLRPIDSVYRGVTEDHFRQPRSRQEMLEIVEAAGLLCDRSAFQTIYDAACTEGGSYGCCSLEGFIKAKMELAQDAMGLPPL